MGTRNEALQSWRGRVITRWVVQLPTLMPIAASVVALNDNDDGRSRSLADAYV